MTQVYLRAEFGVCAVPWPNLLEESGVVTFADNDESDAGKFPASIHDLVGVS